MNAALLQIVVSKRILSRSEANSLDAANGAASTQQLLLLLKKKVCSETPTWQRCREGSPRSRPESDYLRSSALMNLFETTFFGAYWGNLYERSPQFRFGLVHKLGGSRNFKLSPEVAIMMPSEGNLPAAP
jgi:hypothetical protein